VWVAMDSSADGTDGKVLVYVQLLGEGTTVFRPVWARPIGPSVVELLMPEDYDPEDEEWEFKPGATVHVERRELGGEQLLVAVRIAAS